MELFLQIATLTGLQFDIELPIRQDPALKRETVRILFDAGLCPDRERIEKLFPSEKQSDLPLAEQECNSREFKFPAESSIMDKLGEYRPTKKEIVIYDAMCQLAAAALDVDIEVLKQIVVAHEIAHAVTHLGRDAQGRIWEHFDIAETEDKELFAQVYPLFYFKETGDTNAVKVFIRLSGHQDERYNSWRGYEKASLSEVNQALLEARRKEAPDLMVQRSSMGFGINMIRSSSDVTGNAMILGDGRVFYGSHWGLPTFKVGEQAQGRVPPATLAELRRAISESGIMRVPEQTFGTHYFMDGGVTNLTIKLGSQQRHWQANCGEWGSYENIFDKIEKLFRKAVSEVSKI